MEIVLNGKKTEAPQDASLAQLIESLRLDGPVAAMVNDEIIHRGQLSSRKLSPGDRVELLRMMGGG